MTSDFPCFDTPSDIITILEKCFRLFNNYTPIQSNNQLKERIEEKWQEMSQESINAAIDQFRARLHAIITAKGSQIEHVF